MTCATSLQTQLAPQAKAMAASAPQAAATNLNAPAAQVATNSLISAAAPKLAMTAPGVANKLSAVG